MGTRNLTCIWIDGDFKVAQYCQWDGYPGGQGADILAFLKSADLESLKRNARASRWMTPEEIEAVWIESGADRGASMVSMEVAERVAKKHPQLSRDTGAKILPLLAKKPLALRDSRAFATDGLFCEWAYVIDLDAMMLEVYHGFNQTPGKDHGKFSGLTPEKGRDEKYTPVVLVKSYPLSDLPDQDAFEAECDPSEEEVDA